MEVRQLRDIKVGVMESAYKLLLKKLVSQGYEIKFVHPINRGRYMIVEGNPENILIMFKREPFYSFQKMFREQGAKGLAETVNIADLKLSIQKNVTRIYTIYGSSSTVYTITIEDFLNNSIKWQNKEGKDVRSVSLHLLTKVCKLL